MFLTGHEFACFRFIRSPHVLSYQVAVKTNQNHQSGSNDYFSDPTTLSRNICCAVRPLLHMYVFKWKNVKRQPHKLPVIKRFFYGDPLDNANWGKTLKECEIPMTNFPKTYHIVNFQNKMQ